MGPAIAGILLLISYSPILFFLLQGLLVILLISFQDAPDISFKKEHSKEISMFDYRVWPFLIVSAGFGICNASLFQTSSFFSRCYHAKFSRYVAFASIGFMLAGLGVLNGQLLVADRLQTSPGSLIKLGVIFNSISLFGFAFSGH